MPHDASGRPIKVGDKVTIEFTVVHVHEGEEFCNAHLRSTLAMPPYADQFLDVHAVNTRQCVLKEGA